MQSYVSNTQLSEQQLDMLRLFKTPMSEEDFLQRRRLAFQLLANKVDDEMQRLEKEKGWSQETYEQEEKEHMRTPLINSEGYFNTNILLQAIAQCKQVTACLECFPE